MMIVDVAGKMFQRKQGLRKDEKRGRKDKDGDRCESENHLINLRAVGWRARARRNIQSLFCLLQE
jgi:hypothetical protein